MTKIDKYLQDGNSDELSKKFHDRAWGIATDLSKQLLTLSTGIIAAIFVLIFNKKQEFKTIDDIFILLTILSFGVAIFFIILGMQWDARRYARYSFLSGIAFSFLFVVFYLFRA